MFTSHPKMREANLVVFKDPDRQMIELVRLPSAAEIQRMRAVSTAER